MPNRNQMGPKGKGPGTGKGLGVCRDGNENDKKSINEIQKIRLRERKKRKGQ